MAEHFHSLLRSVTIFNIISGLSVPGLPQKYKKYDKLMILYCLLTQLVCFGQAVACAIVISDYMHNANIMHIASIFFLNVGSMFWCIYFISNRKKFENIITRINNLIEVLNNGMFCPKYTFLNDLTKRFRFTKLFMTIVFFSFTSLPMVNNTQKLIRSWRLFGLDGHKVFNYQVPYDAFTSPIYEITILMQGSSLFWACTCQGCTIYLFVTFYFLITYFYKHLQDSIHYVLPSDEFNLKNDTNNNMENKIVFNNIEKNFDESDFEKNIELLSNIDIADFLKQWIKVHQEVLSISKELIEMYSPVLAVYFLYIYISVAFTIFSAIQNTHSHTGVEVIVLAYFTLLTIVNFYMLCASGNYIMAESAKLSWAVYCTPWYSLTHEHKSLIRTVTKIAAKPVIVTCFGSTAFDLSNATFIVIVKSIVSFYLGLVQMRK